MRALLSRSTASLYDINGTGVELCGNVSMIMVMYTAMASRVVMQYPIRSPDSGTSRNTSVFKRLRHRIGSSKYIDRNIL